jgi:hypothetical protein
VFSELNKYCIKYELDPQLTHPEVQTLRTLTVLETYLSLFDGSDRIKSDPLKSKLVYVILKNSVLTGKKTLYFTIAQIRRLALFKDIVAV